MSEQAGQARRGPAGGDDGTGSARAEAERLLAAGLAALSTALQGAETRRRMRTLAERVLGDDQLRDLAAGLSGYVDGVTGGRPGANWARAAQAGSGDAGLDEAGLDEAGLDEAGPDQAGPDQPGADAGADGARPPGGAASGGHAGTGFATGSADCCVCPVCRLVSALRDPSPEFAAQLATAAGDLAVGAAGLMRAVSGAVARPATDTAPPAPARASGTASEGEPAAGTVPRPGEGEGEAGAGTVPAPGDGESWVTRRPMAKKATRKRAPRTPDPEAGDET